MASFLIQQAAAFRLDEIYRYSLAQWGKKAAQDHINGLFDSFAAIETNQVFSKPVPAEFAVKGYFYQYQKHFVYWKYLSSGQVGIVTILHQRMHQIEQFKTLLDH